MSCTYRCTVSAITASVGVACQFAAAEECRPGQWRLESRLVDCGVQPCVHRGSLRGPVRALGQVVFRSFVGESAVWTGRSYAVVLVVAVGVQEADATAQLRCALDVAPELVVAVVVRAVGLAAAQDRR